MKCRLQGRADEDETWRNMTPPTSLAAAEVMAQVTAEVVEEQPELAVEVHLMRIIEIDGRDLPTGKIIREPFAPKEAFRD